MLKIKKEDEVVVIAGRDKGKRGEVLQEVLGSGKLLVSGYESGEEASAPDPNVGQRGGYRRAGSSDRRIERGDLER